MVKDYRIEVKVKNNNILRKIEEAGYKSVGEFCRLNNKMTWASRIGDYVNLKSSPLNCEGEFFPHVYEICDLLMCSPEDLFNETQIQTALESNKRTMEVNEAEMKFMLENNKEPLSLEDGLAMQRMPEKVQLLLENLTPREAKVIKMRFGIGEYEPMTLREVADEFGVTSARIRDIEVKALRRLRHPGRHQPIAEYINEKEVG